jgi:hsp70-interacting protein
MASSGSSNSPFAWLGLLKWSLAYSDGTRPSSEEFNPMSKEDIEFLENVMKDGIIDEGERMKEILRNLTDALDVVLTESTDEEKRKELEEDDMLDLFQELRDIVEQIDYARAFMAMGGIKFLLGCATTDGNVPKSIRKSALSVLATMCQNNPPVQLNLLEVGHMPQLIQLFMDYTPTKENGNAGDDSIREKVVQALSASIRGHSMAEHIFCKNEQGKLMLRLGLGVEAAMDESQPKPSNQLRKRSLFLLRAILTADDATSEEIKDYKSLVIFVCTHAVNIAWEDDAEVREMGLQMLTRLLSEHTPSETLETARSILAEQKNIIASVGVRRIEEIRALEEGSEDRDYDTLELDAWEVLMTALSKI